VSSLVFNAINSTATIDINGNLGQLTVKGSLDLGQTGHINVSNDLTSSFSVGRNLVLDGGHINIGRDLSGTVSVGGNLTVDDGGQFTVTRNLTSVSVGGNLQTSQRGQINIGRNLGTLAVTGVVRGQGSEDIVVGDDLGQLTVLGGGSGTWGLQGVNIDVTKNLQGLDIRNGMDDSLITAGYLINGGTPGAGSNGWNVGPDGTVAVLDSQIRAGFEMRNITIGGDVKSDFPSNPTTGGVTRIVAGEDKNGNFSAGGIIDNFQIVGNLIDSVLAASVAPSEGYYHQPAGAIEVGFVSNPTTTIDTSPNNTIPVPTQPVTVTTGTTTNVGLVVSTPSGAPVNPTQLAQLQNSPLSIFTAPPFANTPDTVLPNGSINPSFAPALQLVPPAADAGAELPLPSKPTVLGSVITTSPHVDGTDYAGIFAANTNGVIVGPLPTSTPVVPA
jgi:hypothetical protein